MLGINRATKRHEEEKHEEKHEEHGKH
jgi:hypothetical protein